MFTGRTDAEAEAPILSPPDVKRQLIGKDPDAGRDPGQEEKGPAEHNMIGWHHQLNGHEFQQTLGDNGGQGSLACCSPWGRRESDLTERLNDSKAQAVGSLGGGALRTRVRPLRILFLFPAHVGG